ncbi:MAG: methionyl-tRNA formyltransferase [Gammaproteobacteria bacterium]|nr:methionyl-tRNA formyltransferase [Gammaproteobacteria bacterium]
MHIVIHGQQAFGRAVLERLIEREEEIVAVCTAPDKEGRPLDPLKELALEQGLPVHQPDSWKTPEALTLMQSFDADVCIMAYVLLFIPQPVLDAPRLGSFQYHPSLLPMHRGPSSINWPIAMGATRTGLSIFWPNDGLDEGPVLMQKECDIGPDETLGDIYFNKLYPMGVDAMIESLDLVKAGTAPKRVQDLDQGSYESWFGKAQAEIDWSKPAAEIYNTIRAANPQPGAWTTANDATVQVYDSRLIDTVAGDAGVVVEVNDDGILIAAGDEAGVLISRVRPAGEAKISAAEYAASSRVKAGDHLG